MSEIALAKINSFAPVAQQADVQPSEEPIFVLTGSQLQEIINEATKLLNSRIDAMEDRIICQDEKIAALEATQDTQGENELNMLRLINDLRGHSKPTITQARRIEILRSLLVAHEGKMLTKEARQIMKMDKGDFSRLVGSMAEYVETKPYSLNKRQTILILK